MSLIFTSENTLNLITFIQYVSEKGVPWLGTYGLAANKEGH